MDPNSFSQVSSVSTRHLHICFERIDFNENILAGYVILCLEVASNKTTETLVLDSRQLTISAVEQANSLLVESDYKDLDKLATETFAKHFESSSLCQFLVGAEHPSFGSALTINCSRPLATGTMIRIRFQTSPSCSAGQWLNPKQTSSKTHPYFFTQCQAIHARSLLPCQDSPAIKSTFTAELTVPRPLKAVMSGLSMGSRDIDQETSIFLFKQPVPIPSYLIAIAIGNLHSLPIGPRSKVWSEPTSVKAGQFEFEDTENFIKVAEEVVGPYVWGAYDVLLMPGSFPYGGMENTCLTFVTPTLIAGDKSLVDVVAHEISHSWAGNLVTNKNWQHFWLNEGFCVFIERKIIGRIHGEASRQFKSIIGWNALQESINLFGKDNPLTCLVTDLNNVDPDDAFSSVPYEKGYNLLYHLETVLGGPAIFEPYVKAHFEKFKFKSIDTNDWKLFLYDYIKSKHPEKVQILNKVDWQTWLHKPGMPPVKMPFDTTMTQQCKNLINAWTKPGIAHSSMNAKEYESLTTDQKIVFFELLAEIETPLSVTGIEAIRTLFKMDTVRNCEIRFRWFQVCLKSKYQAIIPLVVQFLQEQGRMKYVRPLYRSLSRMGDDGKKIAKETFSKFRSSYHPIASQMVAKDLSV